MPLLLPDRFSLAPKWIEPALLAVLLAAHIIADPGRIDRQSRATRMIGVGLLAVREHSSDSESCAGDRSGWFVRGSVSKPPDARPLDLSRAGR